jgi:hypothetical protein
MKLPSPQEFLDKLAASPADAAAFDRATQRERPGKTRREAVAACHALAVATFTEIEANKRKLIAARQKITALEKAKATNQRLRASLAASKVLLAAKQARRITAKPAAKAPTIRQQYNAITTPEAREKFRAANWSALLSSPK